LSKSGYDFIDDTHLHELLDCRVGAAEVREVIAKSMSREALSVEEAAVLLAAEEPGLLEPIFDAARRLKREVYGDRIVLFAPLYVGNECTNDCVYCAFRRSNRQTVRRTLDEEELRAQVAALLGRGHKRLVLVFGEHRRYNPRFIADCVRQVYAVRQGREAIRQVNVNAAPLDHEGFAAVKAAGIGTYQVVQETYHHDTYARVHPTGTRKNDYLWRLDGPGRAIESGCGDVGLGALFGLYDWRFEVLGLVRHGLHLQQHYGVGPRTVSFPRMRPAGGVGLDDAYVASDGEFKRLIAVMRLAMPYTGLVLAAREPRPLRREVTALGVSQIDVGSPIELGGDAEGDGSGAAGGGPMPPGEPRPLDDVLRDLMVDGYLPSFCTACYRLGRTGEHFTELAAAGFIQRFCTPNALATLMEYLTDYGSRETYEAGKRLIEEELARLPDGDRKRELMDRWRRIRETEERDVHF